MTQRTRRFRTSREYSLEDIRSRREARRSRTSPRQGNPAHPQSEKPDEGSARPDGPAIPSAVADNYVGDMLAERSAIMDRIAVLQLEISKEQRDLAAIDIILARVNPSSAAEAAGAQRDGTSGFLDVSYEVLPR